MQQLLFSIQTTLPITLLLALGFYLKKKGLITESFIGTATKLVFYYALPAFLFMSVCKRDFRSLLNGRFILYSVGVTLLAFFLSWGVGLLFVKDKRSLAAMVHGTYRGNFAYVGIAAIANILGADRMSAAVLVLAFVVPLYNILAILILSLYGNPNRKHTVGSVILSILKNPLILALAAGVVFSFLPCELPAWADKTLTYLGQMSTPLALIFIGASLRFDYMKQKTALVVCTIALKEIIFPVLFVGIAIAMKCFSVEDIVTIFVMLAAPSAANTYIMAREMGGDSELAACIVAVTTVVSMLVLPFGTFILGLMMPLA